MTREEAIKHLLYDWFSSLGGRLCVDADNKDRFCEAIGMAVTALCNQRTPAKLDRRRWNWCVHCENGCCCTCKFSTTPEKRFPCNSCDNGEKYEPENFCPNCGRLLTEEAWAELERRINGGQENS